MTLFRLAIGWGAVSLWFLIFELVEQRFPGPAPGGGRRLRAPVLVYLGDALIFTLFAALWFASLGHGGWLLLFLMVGLVVEGPARFRAKSSGMELGANILPIALGILRIVIAGGILAWTL